MSIGRWQREFDEALGYKSCIILCGNIRDKYPYREPHTEDVYKLLTLKEYLIESLRRRAKGLKFYDPISKITDYSLTQGTQTPKGPAQLPQKKPADDLSQTASQRKTPVESTIDRDLVRIRKELVEQEDTYFVIQYTDKTTLDKALTQDDMRLILHLEKMIENIQPTNRLILIYLFPDQIPKELYQNQPKTEVIEIPSPDRADLRILFKDYYRRSEQETEKAVNVTDGLKFLEIEQIVNSLKGGFDVKDLEECVRSYKFGETENYWEEVSLEKLDNAFEYFTKGEGIKGQDEAIKKVVKVIIRARADIQRKTGGNPKSPRGKLFFAGPTGVGKTLTAKKLAKFLFGAEDAFLRFDMSEYSQEFQVNRLYGAPPGYVGYESGGTLTNAIKARPFSVILFDEIEKAHPGVFDIFLQILEDGRLTDSRGDTVFFSESIIIFTSNIGTRTTNTKGEPIPEREELDRLRSTDDSQGIRRHFLYTVEHFFQYEISRSELLNRIGRDNIIVFNYISTEETMKGMLNHHLDQVQREFNDFYKRITPALSLNIEVKDVGKFLYEQYKDQIQQFGGRQVENTINEHIRDRVALFVLQAEYQSLKSATIKIGIEDDELRFELQ